MHSKRALVFIASVANAFQFLGIAKQEHLLPATSRFSARILTAALVALLLTGSAFADAAQDCVTLNVRDAAQDIIKACSSAIISSPKTPQYYINRGKAYSETAKYDLALADFAKAADLDPKNPEVYAARAQAHEWQGRIERALPDWNLCIELDPNNGGCYVHRGLILELMGDNIGAIADWSKLLSGDPNDPVNSLTYSHRADAFRRLGDNTNALADYAKVIQLDPASEDTNAYLGRGILHYTAGDFRAATDDFRRIPESAESVQSLLLGYLASSKAGRAATAELEKKAARLADKDWPYAVIELFLGKRTPQSTIDAAAISFKRCDAFFYVGEWHLLKGNKAEGINFLTQAVETCKARDDEYLLAVAELKRVKR